MERSKSYYLLAFTNELGYFGPMKRTVNHKLIDNWMIEEKKGMAELAIESGLSIHTLSKIRNTQNPMVPSREISMLRLARTIGVEVDELFPIEDSEAS